MTDAHPERSVDVPQVDFDMHTGDALADQDEPATEHNDSERSSS